MKELGDALTQRAEELPAELTEWAQEQGILEPNKRITVTLGIENTELLDMSPREFFSRENLELVGANRANATRIINGIRYAGLIGDYTMQKFLEEYDYDKLIRMRNLGETSAQFMIRLMRESGLALGAKWNPTT